jgi:hypothetical protein
MVGSIKSLASNEYIKNATDRLDLRLRQPLFTFLDRVEAANLLVKEIDGITTLTLTLVADSDESAAMFRNVAEGIGTMLQLICNDPGSNKLHKHVLASLNSIQLDASGKDFTLRWHLDSDAVEFAKYGLEALTQQLNSAN